MLDHFFKDVLLLYCAVTITVLLLVMFIVIIYQFCIGRSKAQEQTKQEQRYAEENKILLKKKEELEDTCKKLACKLKKAIKKDFKELESSEPRTYQEIFQLLFQTSLYLEHCMENDDSLDVENKVVLDFHITALIDIAAKVMEDQRRKAYNIQDTVVSSYCCDSSGQSVIRNT